MGGEVGMYTVRSLDSHPIIYRKPAANAVELKSGSVASACRVLRD